MTDNDRLHDTHKLLEAFNYVGDEGGKPCGCITRGDGQLLRKCARHGMSRSLSGKPVKLNSD